MRKRTRRQLTSVAIVWLDRLATAAELLAVAAYTKADVPATGDGNRLMHRMRTRRAAFDAACGVATDEPDQPLEALRQDTAPGDAAPPTNATGGTS